MRLVFHSAQIRCSMQFLKFLKPQPFPDGAALKIMAMVPSPH
jgi:hypothetical protein